MSFSLTNFTIHKLHGDRDVSIPINDNRIVMVGVNGLGKTTIINLLYLTLSRQWDRTTEYDFSAIEFTLNGDSYLIDRNPDGSRKYDASRVKHHLFKILPRSHFQKVIEEPEFHRIINSGHITEGELFRLSAITKISWSMLRRAFRNITSNRHPFDEAAREKADQALKACLHNDQILYLPTYRRIEKDFQLIFPELEEDIQRFNHRRMIEAREGGKSYLELVEFGMEDVESTFRRIGKELSDTARTQVTSLAGSYLRDVIRGEGDTYNPKTFKELDAATITTILNRVESGVLEEEDKILLQSVIEKFKDEPNYEVSEKDKYVAHYFSKLIRVHEALTIKEQSANTFTRVCNKYLRGKHIVYDDKTYEFSVVMNTEKPILLRQLSSGEKQIVSLFCHLYLQREGDLIVLIDEPELSLSVDWQKTLLPDIMATKRCRFLAAVTHSPFIFDNILDHNTLDLATCISKAE